MPTSETILQGIGGWLLLAILVGWAFGEWVNQQRRDSDNDE